MGAKSSRASAPDASSPPSCKGCGLAVPRAPAESPSCVRCGSLLPAALPPAAAAAAAAAASQPAAAPSSMGGGGARRPPPLAVATRVVIRPFGETLTEEERDEDGEALVQRLVVPFFERGDEYEVRAGARFRIGGSDWKVVGCSPPRAATRPGVTRFHSQGRPLEGMRPLRRVVVRPTAASLANYRGAAMPDALAAREARPFLAGREARHLSLGECFVSEGGVQFRVTACDPPDGLVTPRTEVECSGAAPLPDAARASVMPIFETLPNRDKALDERGRVDKYLEPYFAGRFQELVLGTEMDIDMVTWMVTACAPHDHAVVTLQTALDSSGPALRADDIKEQQMHADEELAMQLQREESGGLGGGGSGGGRGAPGMRLMFGVPPPRGRRGGSLGRGSRGGRGGMGGRERPRLHSAGADMGPNAGGGGGGGVGGERRTTAAEIEDRLTRVLDSMPPNDRHRRLIELMRDELHAGARAGGGAGARAGARGGGGGAGAAALPLFAAFPPRRAAAREQEERMLQAEIESLPTRVYSRPPDLADEEKAAEVRTCTVCLSEYEEGETLRTLQCFHSYHAECIDPWLRQKPECPMCKHSIRASQQQWG